MLDDDDEDLIAADEGQGQDDEDDEELAGAFSHQNNGIELDNGLMQQYEHVMNFGQASLNVIQALKTHLRQEYSWYSKKEIEQMVYKFLNEYLAKLQMLTAGNNSSDEGSSMNNDTLPAAGGTDQYTQRTSMSSIFDFNDKERIEQ